MVRISGTEHHTYIAPDPRLASALYRSLANELRADGGTEVQTLNWPAPSRAHRPALWTRTNIFTEQGLRVVPRHDHNGEPVERRTLIAHSMGAMLARNFFDKTVVDDWVWVSPSIAMAEVRDRLATASMFEKLEYERERERNPILFDRAVHVTHPGLAGLGDEGRGIVVVGEHESPAVVDWAGQLAEITQARLVELPEATHPLLDYPVTIAALALNGADAIGRLEQVRTFPWLPA